MIRVYIHVTCSILDVVHTVSDSWTLMWFRLVRSCYGREGFGDGGDTVHCRNEVLSYLYMSREPPATDTGLTDRVVCQ